MGLSIERLESLSLRELSLLFRRDPKGNGLSDISVTEVRITRDLSYMTIFYTFYVEMKRSAPQSQEEVATVFWSWLGWVQ